MGQVDLTDILDEEAQSETLREILCNSKDEKLRIFLKWESKEVFSILKILDEEVIWEWTYWVVKKIKCTVEGVHPRTCYFAVKEYKDRSHKILSKRCYRMYIKLKEAWISTWNTCRLGFEENSLLMSLWNLWNKLFISINKNSDDFDVSKLELGDYNFDELSKGIIEDMIKAKDHKINISPDAFMIWFDPDNDTFEHIVWDLDLVRAHDKKLCPLERLIYVNLETYVWWLFDLRKSHDVLAEALFASYRKTLEKYWYRINGDLDFFDVVKLDS